MHERVHSLETTNSVKDFCIMRKPALLLTLTLCAGLVPGAHAALTIQPLEGAAFTAGDLARTLSGSTAVSNVTFSGLATQAGLFAGGTSARLSIDAGVVLSTGRAIDLANTALVNGADTDLRGAGDAALTGLMKARTHDSAAIDFDLTPRGNRLTMRYVFGSSEYNSWVASDFNDTFAAFVNGKNYALVPGTADLVSVRGVNCGIALPGSRSATGIAARNCNQFHDNWTATSLGQTADVALGGLTRTFVFDAPLNPGVSNHLHLVIGDAADGTRDSAVFIEARSLNAVPEPSALQFAAAAALLMVFGWRRAIRN
jgi:hypothetical protein